MFEGYHGPLEARGQLPMKMAGQHRWVVIVLYSVTDNMVEDTDQGVGVFMDSEHMLDVRMVCWDCSVYFGTEEAQGICTVGGN